MGVVWGTFSQMFGTAINRVAVLKSDLSGLDNTTSPYASFNSGIISGGGANHSVQYGYVQWPNIILAGTFTSFNGSSYGHLVRLNANGVVDNSFNPGGSGLDDRPFRLFSPPNVSVVKLVGAFRNFNGTPRGGIAVLNTDYGALQPSYANLTVNSDTPGTVYAEEGAWISRSSAAISPGRAASTIRIWPGSTMTAVRITSSCPMLMGSSTTLEDQGERAARSREFRHGQRGRPHQPGPAER